MIPLTHYSRSRRVLFVIVIVSLITAFTSIIFVSAGNNSLIDTPATTATPPDTAAKTRVAERFGKLPLSFERNEGQVDAAVKFLSHGPGYDLFLTADEAVLSLRKPRELKSLQPQDPQAEPEVREGTVLRLKMIGANVGAQIEGQGELPGKVNYFTGNDPEKWRRNVPTFQKVHYKDVYPGIDVVYYGNQQELEYDFVIAPGANPKVIKFRLDGADRIRVDEKGNLLLALEGGEVRLNKPFIYQLAENGSRKEIKGAYAINGKEISFKVRGFDAGKPLVIDPVLSYSTFLGSGGDDIALSIAVDSQGSAYVTGNADSTTFPTTSGAFKSTTTTGGAFVTKLDPTGSSLVYSTYLNGSGGSTQGFGIAVDASGSAYVTGVTTASDFPLLNSLKSSGNFFKTSDSAASWNNNNTGLPGDVRSIGVTPVALQIIYAGTPSGPYRSTDFGATWTKLPTTGAPVFPFAVSLGVSPVNSAVVFAGFINGGLYKSVDGGNTWNRLSLPSLGTLVSTIVFDPVTPSTLYAGTANGVFRSVDTGSTWTTLNNFPGLTFPPNVRALAIDPATPSTIYAGTSGNGIFKTTNGGTNWSPTNNGLTGGEANFVNALAIDPSNSSIVYSGHGSQGGSGAIHRTTNGGTNWSPVNPGVPNFPVIALVADRTAPSTLYAATAGGGIVKTPNGGLSWTNANTGLWQLNVATLVAHPTNSAILYAGTSGTNSQDAFVTRLNSSGSALLFSSYLGGSKPEIGHAIAVDSTGNIYVVGETESLNFPTANAIQPALSSAEVCTSGFVTKIDPSAPSYVFSTYLGGRHCDMAHGVAVDNTGDVYIAGQTSSFDFPLANAFQPTIGELFASDAFVTKLSTAGSMVYSTFLGGDGGDIAYGIAVDTSGQAYVTGRTFSLNFPTLNQISGARGFGDDTFVTKLNSQGSALVYSSYVGGDSIETARGIAVDTAGAAYVTGFTDSRHFPLTAGALRTQSTIFKSLDGGVKWSNDNYGMVIAVNREIKTLAVHPTQTSTIYAGTGSGVFKSTNGGRNWTAMNNGLNDTRVAELIIDPLTPSTLYVMTENFGITTHGIYKSTDGGDSWNFRKNGIGSAQVIDLAIDPVQPNILYASTTNNFGQGQIFKTTDGADNWTLISPVVGPTLTSLAVDPHDHQTVFAVRQASNEAIYISGSGGANFVPISIAETGPFGTFIAPSPLTPGLVYAQVGTKLFKSVNGGFNWTQVAERNGKVAFDPVNPNTIYSLATNSPIQKSTDNGATWVPLNPAITGPVVLAMAIDPLTPSTLHIASRRSGGGDSFVYKVNPAGNALVYSTYLGGISEGDFSNVASQAVAIAVDNGGNAYVSGVAFSPGFPTTPGSVQPLRRFFSDAFISKLAMSHIIRGQVLNSSNAPISRADVVLNDGTSITQIVTEADGSYEFPRLRAGGTYTVSAAKAHFTMAPSSQTFNNLNADQTLNFIATATNSTFFTVNGQITNNGAGLAGVTVTLSGSQSGLRITDANGNYSFELAAGGNYTLTPALLGFTFGPTSQTFNNLSTAQAANFAATRQNFVVTNTNNHGAGSLREAIANANATAGADTIVFNIPGPGVKLIGLMNPLPEITEQIVIDGTTQPGYAGAPLVELDGSALLGSNNGLVLNGGNSTIRGLAIGGFKGGAAIAIRTGDNNVIQANRIGVDATGSVARPNSNGITLVISSNNLIGGTTAAVRNIISGNTNIGIELAGGDVSTNVTGSNNIVQGNYIGTNAAGTASIANGAYGVSSFIPGGTNNLIGGTSAGARNVISGNQLAGIRLNGDGHTVQGNLIGTDITGTQSIANGTGIIANATNAQIGGLTPAARNIISGNNNDGVNMRGAGSKLEGNYIGTDITGTAGLGNLNSGVVAGNNVLVGGTTPEARNVISGNSPTGNFRGNVALGWDSAGTAATVQGNYIGTDVTGTVALTPATSAGITIFSDNHVIGGAAAGARNVISGHIAGIQVLTSRGNVIKGNFIGLNAQGTGPIPNSLGGIFVNNENTIGGTQPGEGNTIAFNGGPGVNVIGGRGTTIRGNSIFSNRGLGIDLGQQQGITPNDLDDTDTGPNDLQNFPTIISVARFGSNTVIQGILRSTPGSGFQIDFYSNSAVDPSGNGEGAQFFATTPAVSDGSGIAVINVSFPIVLPAGRVLTATATDSNGNTSEFSVVDPASAAGSLQFDFDSFFVIEDVGTANVTVRRAGGSSGPLSVQYATANGTAIAGQDYTATSGTLNFANGETSKTIQIPILSDGPTEPDETFTLALKNATSLESLGSPSTMTITIQDKITIPSLLVFDTSVVEGNTGTSTDALVEVRLSAATGRTVSVQYSTANFSAHGFASCANQGADYESKSGTITFQPGTFSTLVPIKVCGDNSAEVNENFGLILGIATNATIGHPQGVVTIINDDELQLLLEEPGQLLFGQVAALDALLFVRDPFRVVSVPELFANGTDRNTRVALFVRNLELNPGETSAAVVVRLVAGNNLEFFVPAESFRAVPGQDFMQLVFRLPNLPAGTTSVSVRAHLHVSNVGTFRIVP